MNEVNYDEISDEQAEKIAQARGWVPEERFEGEGWKDARSWLKTGELIEQQRQRKIDRMESEMAELRRTLVEQKEFLEGARAKAMEENKRLREKLLEQKAEAYVTGDKDQALKVEKQLLELDEADRLEAKDETKDEKKPPTQSEAHREFARRNADWFNVDQDATDMAYAVAYRLEKENPNMALDDILRTVEKRVRAKMAPPAPSVASGGERGGKGKTKRKTFNDLPADAKAQFKKFAEAHKTIGKEYKPEDYAASYWAQEGE